jgi:hypothetical protein
MTSSPTPLKSGPSTAPDSPSGHPLSRGIMYKNPLFSHKDFPKPSVTGIYGKRGILRGAVKTLMVNTPWRNSWPEEVQDRTSKKKGCFF